MERTRPSQRMSRTLGVLTVLACIAALYFASEVLIPIALAVLLAFALAPLVRRLERLRVPRVAAAFVVMGLFLGAVVGLGWVLHGEAVQLATDLPGYKTNIAGKLSALRGDSTKALDRATTTIKEIGREIVAPDNDNTSPSDSTRSEVRAAEPMPVRVVDASISPLQSAESLLGPVISRLATGAIIVVFTIFILVQREELRNRLLRLMGKESMHVSTPALDDATQRVSRYLLLQLVVNTIAGVSIGVGLMVLGVPGALLWGCLTIVLRFIPYIGTFVAAAFPIIISLAVAPDWRGPLMVAGLIVAVETLCGQVIEPLLLASGTGLSPIAVLASALFWGWLWGPVGLLLSTPIAVCLAVMGKHFPRMAVLDLLLSDKVALVPEARLYQRLLAGDPEESARIVAEFRKQRTSLAEVYDGLLIPALRLAQAARQRDDLTDEQLQSVHRIVSKLVSEAAPGEASVPGGTVGQAEVRVLCVPAHDEIDAAAAQMLTQVLCASGVTAEALSADVLTGEVLAMVELKRPSLVCVSAVPPAATMHARMVTKRLRGRFAELPIVVGLWDGAERADGARATLGAAGTQYVATSLAQTLTTVSAIVGAKVENEPHASASMEATAQAAIAGVVQPPSTAPVPF